jgi:glycosyltransferase involved in cell wall biosynthesis
VATPIDIVPTGLSPEAFTPGDGTRFRREHGIAIDRPLLLHVGRLAHEKNIRFLVEMLPRLRAAVPDALLLIAGEGPAERDLRRLVRRRDLAGHVAFTGYLDRRVGLKDCYRAADAFVFASRTETQGLVLLEALAQGTPVVSTAVMGTRDIVEPGRGAVHVAEDHEAFSEAVAALLADGDRRARMADEARAFARAWSARAMAQRLLGSYRAAGTLPAAACPVA